MTAADVARENRELHQLRAQVAEIAKSERRVEVEVTAKLIDPWDGLKIYRCVFNSEMERDPLYAAAVFVMKPSFRSSVDVHTIRIRQRTITTSPWVDYADLPAAVAE